MPTDQANFWSTFADRYDDIVDSQLGGATRAMVRDRVAREPDLGTVVEFGCGTGYFTDVLASRSTSVLATDISPRMLDLARQQITAPSVAFQSEDCQSTSFATATFDTAFISLVIQFTDPERTVAEMRRVLRPGGMLIIANLDPFALNLINRIRGMLRIVHNFVRSGITPPRGFGLHVMSERRLQKLLERNGFRIDSSETIRDLSASSNIPIGYVRAVKT